MYTYYLFMYLHLSTYVSIYLSIYQPTYLSIIYLNKIYIHICIRVRI